VTLGLDGSGKVDIVAGGYDDWEKRRRPPGSPAKARSRQAFSKEPSRAESSPGKKLSYKNQRDLDRLPLEIERIELKIGAAEEELHDPDLYARDPDRFHALTGEVAKLRAEKHGAEERWLEVAAMAEELAR
jgi:ATP-binding cassette subfamily F protein uup